MTAPTLVFLFQRTKFDAVLSSVRQHSLGLNYIRGANTERES